ncbi:MAG: methionyl-tRNA formyltransferase [Candidatus Nomurabacteria bacterium]|jgi:methionyl-tRNA formyltransferase|nr:methionyl-tRNA formyltransferase [Candidatus Nomurabacteria bacterium]
MTKVIFFGSEAISVPTLRMLLAENYEVLAVVTKADSPRGRGHKFDAPAVKKVALEWNAKNPTRPIQIWQPNRLGEIAENLRALRPDIGLLVSYGKIIPQTILDAFPLGIVNFHPSLLPRLRGSSPIETAILDGDSETGLTLMQLVKEMDAGPIFYQEKVRLRGVETKPELYEKFARRGAEILRENLPKIIGGRLKPTLQNDDKATYCQLIKKSDGDLDPAAMTASEIDRRVRAFAGWPRTRLNFCGQNVIITKIKVLDPAPAAAWPDVVKCLGGSAFQVVQLISPKSGKNLSAAEFLRGIK